MLKHILVPLDGSERAERAIPYAIEIATPSTKVTLLYVLELPITPFLVSASPPALPQQTENYDLHRARRIEHAREYLRQASSSFEGKAETIETRVILGSDPAEKILDFSEAQTVDVIVMATRGHSGIKWWFMGSVTQKVLQAASCPVFVVPSP